MTLSFCAIVKNEAANLPRCLESVQSVVDQIVILDTGSTDETVAIARSFGAEVHYFPWNNSFADARNESLNYVTGDWVLVLDADEALNPPIVPQLKQAMQPQAIVVNLVRQEIGAVQSPYSLVSRLFRRHPDLYFSRPYHAMVDDSVAILLQKEPDWQVVNLPDVAILHYGYEPGTIARRDKLQKARQTMEGFLASHPDDPYVCAKLGALYVQMGDLPQGLELLQRGLRQSQDNPAVRYELHYHLGIAYRQAGDLVAAVEQYRAALQQPILDRLKLGAQNNLGSLLLGQGDLQAAKACFEAVVQLDPTLVIGHHNLGMTCKALGQFGAAIEHYQRAIQLNPGYAEAYQNLGVVWLKLGRVSESLAAFQRAIDLHQQQNSPEADRLRRGLRDMGFSI